MWYHPLCPNATTAVVKKLKYEEMKEGCRDKSRQKTTKEEIKEEDIWGKSDAGLKLPLCQGRAIYS